MFAPISDEYSHWFSEFQVFITGAGCLSIPYLPYALYPLLTTAETSIFSDRRILYM